MATCSFLTATDAINLSRNNTVIWTEICELQKAILAAIDSNLRDTTVAGGTPMTSTGEITAASLDAGGSGYSIETATATIDANGTGGTLGAVTPVVTNGVITSFTIDNGGSGYTPVDVTATVGNLYDLVDAQTHADYEGTGTEGTFAGGDDYFVGEVITMNESSAITVDAITATGVVTIAAQDETNFTGGSPNGSFVGGNANPFTGYLAGQTITMNEGTTVLVDAVDGNGDVTQFTIQTTSVSATASGATLTQDSVDSGQGAGFTLTLDTNNETAVGLVTQFTVNSAGAVPFLFPSVITQSSTTGIGVGFTLTPGTFNVTVVSAGSGAILTPIVTNGVITSIVINNGGSGYNNGSPVLFSHPSGAGASATVVTTGGVVTAITLVSGGSGYETANALVTVTHSTGFGFQGTVNTTGGVITSISIQDGGSLYADVYPYVEISDATGSGASILVTGVSAGALASIQLAAGGSNYSQTPSVLIFNSDGAANNSATITLTVEANTYGTNPNDYYLVLEGQATDRVISDQLQYVLDYFTALGYNIRAQVNPATNNTIQWQIIW